MGNNTLGDALGASGFDDEDGGSPIDAVTRKVTRGRPPAVEKPVEPEQPRRETADEAVARIRAERDAGTKKRLLGGFMQKLQIDAKIPGFHMVIIDDQGDRLDTAVKHGYAFVQADEVSVGENVTSFNTDVGSKVRFTLGSRADGQAGVLYGYLMKIPTEIFEEDMAAQEVGNRKVDQAIRAGYALPGETREDAERRYTMSGHRYDPGAPTFHTSRKE